MYNIKQFMTTPYNPHGDSQCKRLNHILHDLLKTLPKEQKTNWPLYFPLFVFTYNVVPHHVTCFQPYELMFGHKALNVCDAWQELTSYYDKTSISECTWLNKWLELLLLTGVH